MTKWLVAVSITTFLFTGVVQAAGDPEAGKAKAATCAACHGPDGNSPNPMWPKLSGQYPAYLKDQILAFRDKERFNELMAPMVAALADQDADDLAAYFSAQARTVVSAPGAPGGAGEKLYRAGDVERGIPACSACHGPSGVGSDLANFPAVSGQHAPYTDKALKDFRDGKRTNDPQKMMQQVAESLTDEDIAAVSQYIQGLQ